MLRAVIDGRLDRDAFLTSVAPHIDLCLGCLACEQACVLDVQYGRLLGEARIQLEEIRPVGAITRAFRGLILRNIIPSTFLLKMAARVLWAYQVSGLQTLVRRLSVLPRGLDAAEKLIPQISTAFPRYNKPAPAHGEKIGRVALFIGCMQEALLVNINQAAVRVLQRSGFEVVFPPQQTCCGALHLHSGDEKTAIELAHKNVDVFLESDCDVIISTAGGCGFSLKEYSILLEKDPEYVEKARVFSSKIQDLSEFLEGNIRTTFKPVDPLLVAYIDSCHLRHGQRVIEQPRTLLEAIPGLEIIDLPNPERCCGSAGTYNLSEIEPADALLAARVDEIAASGAEIVVTSNTGCHMQLMAGIRGSGLPVAVMHLAEVMDLAYQGELSKQIKTNKTRGSFKKLDSFDDPLAWLQDRRPPSIGKSVVSSLKPRLPRGRVLDDLTTLLAYERDVSEESGLPGGVVILGNAEEVQQVVKWANETKVPIVARGAGTGMSGGAVARRESVVVHFSLMRAIEGFDPWSRSVMVQPGVVNQRLKAFVRERGLFYPPDPASFNVSTIGGNISTNAGGLHCFKYGVTSNYVCALEVVLADGSHRTLGGGALDAPEYDLRRLVTGSESTLALIVGSEMNLQVAPPSTQTMLATFDKLETAGEAVSAIITAGWIPSVMEIIDRQYMRAAEIYMQAGLPVDAAATLIIEVDGYEQSVAEDIEGIKAILSAAGAATIRIAATAEEAEEIMLARTDGTNGINLVCEIAVGHDVTVPTSRISECLAGFMQIAEELDLPSAHLAHAADGNMHPLFLITDADDADQIARADEAMHRSMELVLELDGSIAGEHGVGCIKRELMPRMYSAEELSAMLDIKHVFDPRGLLNPDKIFPDEKPVVKLPEAGNYADPVQHPASSQEAADLIRSWAVEEKEFRITGSQQEPADLPVGMGVISTGRMRAIRKLELGDQLVFAAAGTPLDELNLELAQHKVMVPLASPWADTTVGGLVSSNTNAPLRVRYGAIKDLLLSLHAILPDGRSIQAGRPLRKNVAGYDLASVFVGSYGTLGLITKLCLKLAPVPERCETYAIPIENLGKMIHWAGAILQNAIVASALLLCSGVEVPDFGSHPCLLYTVEGTPEEVEAERLKLAACLHEAGAPQSIPVSNGGTEIWATWLRDNSREKPALRTGIPPRQLQEWIVEELDKTVDDVPYMLDLAHGMLYSHGMGLLQPLRTSALKTGGYAIVMDEHFPAGIDPWGFQPANLDLMLALKRRWDPKGLANPERFVV